MLNKFEEINITWNIDIYVEQEEIYITGKLISRRVKKRNH